MKERAVVEAKSHRKRFMGTVLAAMAAGALAWSGLAGGTLAASGAATPVADEAPGYAVENFDYPQADKILAEQDIVLKRGDGHITLADCASGTGLLEVWARDNTEEICFRAVGNSGWLTLEIPSVFAVRGNAYATEIDMTVGTVEKSFDIEKNTWTPVGEGVDEQSGEHMLVEIRTSK
jgi:hypothetical protein